MRHLLHKLVPALAIAVLTGLPAAAQASAPGVAWSIQSVASPTNFQPLDTQDQYTLLLGNVGSQDSNGTITITDTLPPGVTTSETPVAPGEVFSCTPGAGNSVVTCTSNTPIPALTFAAGEAGSVGGGGIGISVTVAPGTLGTMLTNQVQVSGGGGASVSASEQTPVSSQPTPFGPLDFSASVLDAGGALDTQAGDHPGTQTTTYHTPTRRGTPDEAEYLLRAPAVEELRQIVIDLPPGFVGNPQAAPTCSLVDLANTGFGGGCAPATQVGTLTLFSGGGGEEATFNNLAIYNVRPEPGYPAEFGIYLPNFQRYGMLYGSVVGSGSDAHVRLTAAPLVEAVQIDGTSSTFFGNPALKDNSPNAPLAFFTNPTNCSGQPLTTTIHVDSWQHPGRFNTDGTPDFSDPNWKSATSTSPPVGGCERLRFDPSIAIQPDTSAADSPTGLHVNIHVPQSSDPVGLATPDLKKAVVTLPAGMTVNPAVANGLAACSPAQIDLSSNGPAGCPDAAKIGTIEVDTPLLDHPLGGSVFVAEQANNPFGSLLALYIAVEDPRSGVFLKVAGQVVPDPQTGQLTTIFDNNPQTPFEDLKLTLRGGPRAALVNPDVCGSYTAVSQLTPWSSETAAELSSGFEVNQGCHGAQFSPALTAGTVNNQAGAFSPLSVTFSRQDQEQDASSVSVTTPPGLLALIKSVERCGEPQASQGTCGPNSLIGHTTVAVGAGPDPFYVQGGQVFLTGPYKGAPFGLSVVVPAVAGPFNLGNVIVRAAIGIDPHTAQPTITSDAFPRILDGVPVQIKTLNVTVDRPGFIFNPTSCEALSVTGTATSIQGAVAPLSSRFQAAGCQGLPFKPVFAVSTQAKTSKKNGASLTVKGELPRGGGEHPQRRCDAPQAAPGAADDDPAGVHCRGVRREPRSVPCRLEYRDGERERPRSSRARCRVRRIWCRMVARRSPIS